MSSAKHFTSCLLALSVSLALTGGGASPPQAQALEGAVAYPEVEGACPAGDSDSQHPGPCRYAGSAQEGPPEDDEAAFIQSRHAVSIRAAAAAGERPRRREGNNVTAALSQRRQVTTRRLDANSSTKATLRMAGRDGSFPCFCETSNPSWTRCTRSVPKCLFIDLGAADGNTFDEFLNNRFGPVKNCPSGGQWEAVLVEANPNFTEKLRAVEQKYQQDEHGVVDALPSTAAYMCQGSTSFYLDTSPVGIQNNYWGSSMSADSSAGTEQRVEVPTVNLNRILYERSIPDDWVIVKMDIEGAEWDIIPCMAQAESASLMDRLFMEVHPNTWGLTGTDQPELEAAKARLSRRGVDIPAYFSPTL